MKVFISDATATVVITGGTSGLGYETAKVVALRGWRVVITSRVLEHAEAAASKLGHETKTQVRGEPLELASQASIRTFAQRTLKRIKAGERLRAVVCNAGISLNGPIQYTEEGVEKVFGVNHLGHFLLVNLLLESLEKPARIVFVSSGTHVPDHKLARRTGTPAPVYTTARELAYPTDRAGGVSAQSLRYTTSKLCNVLCANELARRVVSRELSTAAAPMGVYSIDPGLMPGTGLARDYPRVLQTVMAGVFSGLRPFVDGIRTPQRSAQDVARLVDDPALEGTTGTYYDGHKEARAPPVAYELDQARDLWETSSELVGLGAEG